MSACGLIVDTFSCCIAFLVARHIIGIVPKGLQHSGRKLNWKNVALTGCVESAKYARPAGKEVLKL